MVKMDIDLIIKKYIRALREIALEDIPDVNYMLISKELSGGSEKYIPVLGDKSVAFEKVIKDLIEETSDKLNHKYIVCIRKQSGLIRLSIEEIYVGFIFNKIIKESEEIEILSSDKLIFN